MRTMKRTPSRLIALGAIAALGLAACGDDDDGGDASAPPTEAPAGSEAPAGTDAAGVTITVGSADFPESQLLAEIYAQALEAGGVPVDTELNIGSREVYFAAIESGETDLQPEYTNSLLSFVMRRSDPSALPEATNVDEQVAALGEALPDGLEVLTPSTAEDKDVIVCSGDVAEQYGLATLSDLAEVSGEITIGAPPEFENRAPFGLVGFEEIYGATFAEFVPLDIGAMADAIKGGAIDCGNMFSTMSAITTEGFVALEDDKGVVPNEAVLALIRSEVASDEVVAILDAVSAALDTEGLKAMMVRVEVGAEDPAVVAADFLAENGLAG